MADVHMLLFAIMVLFIIDVIFLGAIGCNALQILENGGKGGPVSLLFGVCRMPSTLQYYIIAAATSAHAYWFDLCFCVLTIVSFQCVGSETP